MRKQTEKTAVKVTWLTQSVVCGLLDVS